MPKNKEKRSVGRPPKKRIGEKYVGLSKEKKKALVMSEGTRFEQVVCPICCLNRIIEKKDKGRIRFDNFDLEKGIMLQVRYGGGGYGSGFYINEAESLTLPEVKKDPRFDDLVEQIKKQCNAILEALA